MFNEKQHRISFFIINIITATIVSVIVSIILINNFNPTKEILSIDLEKIIQQFVADEARKNISSEQKKKQIIIFSKTLDEVIEHDLSQNKVVFVKQAILSGGKDITSSVYSHVQKKMKMEDNNDDFK